MAVDYLIPNILSGSVFFEELEAQNQKVTQTVNLTGALTKLGDEATDEVQLNGFLTKAGLTLVDASRNFKNIADISTDNTIEAGVARFISKTLRFAAGKDFKYDSGNDRFDMNVALKVGGTSGWTFDAAATVTTLAGALTLAAFTDLVLDPASNIVAPLAADHNLVDLGVETTRELRRGYFATFVKAPSVGPSGAQQHTLPAVASDTVALLNAAQTLAAKTLTTPTIASFVNAGHSHQDAAGGGTLNAAAIAAGTLARARLPSEVAYEDEANSFSLTQAFANASPFSVANAQILTVSVAAQTVGPATLTVPNFAGVSDTFAFALLAQTLSNKTLASPSVTGQASFAAGTVSAPSISFSGDLNTGFFQQAADALGFAIGGNEGARLSEPADGETALLVRRNVGAVLTLQRVSMGATDSGGAGFKVLRVPN